MEIYNKIMFYPVIQTCKALSALVLGPTFYIVIESFENAELQER